MTLFLLNLKDQRKIDHGIESNLEIIAIVEIRNGTN